jgi:CheY-like chemotaxis protein
MNDTSHSILVVEDDPHQATLLKRVCSRGDPQAHVHVTRSAEEAIAYLNRPGPDTGVASPVPDIILLDVLMEGIGGLGFLEWYSQQPTFQHIHVVVFTSSSDDDLARRCMSLGAREFIVKSWDFTEVLPVLLQNLADR